MATDPTTEGLAAPRGGADRVRRARLVRLQQFQRARFGDTPEIKESTEVPGSDAGEGQRIDGIGFRRGEGRS
jgi:hypothetical protein